jgi:hypothetical protein
MALCATNFGKSLAFTENNLIVAGMVNVLQVSLLHRGYGYLFVLCIMYIR